MRPVKTKTSDIVFRKEGAGDLPATSCTMNDGVSPCYETVWKLTEEEKQQVQESGRIYLYLVGQSVQPCFLTTESAIEVSEN
jgi:hypothetical protein